MSITSPPAKYFYKIGGVRYEEGDLPDTSRQHVLARYLESGLRQLYSDEVAFITGRLTMYLPNRYFERITPDVLVFKGITLTEAEISEVYNWEIGSPKRPAPNVVIEISSEATWEIDILPDENRQATRR